AAMTTTQLSAVALFGEVHAFRWGQRIVVEGEEADGLYILLSGHLRASVRGAVAGEISEGEIFGEIGLLEGGKGPAPGTGVSADAEVLFMSRASFETLLAAVPAFSWGVRETATGRRTTSPGRPHRSARRDARRDTSAEC